MSRNKSQRRLRWFAVRCTDARAVVKAGVGIARLGVPVFIPKGFRTERRGKWLVSVPDGFLFPPYLFIAMRAQGPWHEVREVDGVARIMGSRPGHPEAIPVPYKEMRIIRRLHRKAEDRLSDDRFKPGQKVRVVSGTFTGFDGVFDRPAKERVKILLSLFGRETEVELAEDEVRAA